MLVKFDQKANLTFTHQVFAFEFRPERAKRRLWKKRRSSDAPSPPPTHPRAATQPGRRADRCIRLRLLHPRAVLRRVWTFSESRERLRSLYHRKLWMRHSLSPAWYLQQDLVEIELLHDFYEFSQMLHLDSTSNSSEKSIFKHFQWLLYPSCIDPVGSPRRAPTRGWREMRSSALLRATNKLIRAMK